MVPKSAQVKKPNGTGARRQLGNPLPGQGDQGALAHGPGGLWRLAGQGAAKERCPEHRPNSLANWPSAAPRILRPFQRSPQWAAQGRGSFVARGSASLHGTDFY